MKIDWNILLLAVLLLWTPMVALIGAETRARWVHPVRAWRMTFLRLVLTPVNWIDFCRAVAGAWLLWHPAINVDASSAHGEATALALRIAILAMAVLLQSGWIADRFIVLGPTFFLLGITVVVAPWPVWFYGFVAGLIAAATLGRCRWHLATVALSIALSAVGFGLLGAGSMVTALLWLVPLLLSGTAHEPIAFLYHRSRHSQRAWV
jgi:hypothetical protein